MTPDQIKQIKQQVHADRKVPLAPLSDPLPFTVQNGRFIEDVSEWNENDLRQLVAVGIDGIGEAWTPERLLEEGEDEGFYKPEVWDVADATGHLAYRIYVYGTDNGTIARKDTPELVAGMSQGGVEISRKKAEGCTDALIEEIAAAVQRIPKSQLFKGSCIRFFGAV